MQPATFVFFLLVFTAVGVIFLFIHLLMGSVIRPSIPETEKLTIYECGEPTVGSAWVQFDLRYYVVALLFVIFDVEVAFFFPWATVFSKANQLSHYDAPISQLVTERKGLEAKRAQDKFTDADRKRMSEIDQELKDIRKQQTPLLSELEPTGVSNERKIMMGVMAEGPGSSDYPVPPGVASSWAMIAFMDIAVFFGVLMVGFAYVWRRGDINWVRAYAPHQEPAAAPEKPLEQPVPVGAK